MAAPMLVGMVAIPHIIENLGGERIGLLAIIWMGVGCFSLFDLGLGRVLTKLVVGRIAVYLACELGSLCGVHNSQWPGIEDGAGRNLGYLKYRDDCGTDEETYIAEKLRGLNGDWESSAVRIRDLG